jgi:hypothetical protein
MQPSSGRPILKSAFLTIALLLSFAVGSYAQQLKIFEDVPKGNWEYGVLHKLEKAIPAIRPSCPGYGGSAERIFTRYEFAVVTKRTQYYLAEKNGRIRHEASIRKLVSKLAVEFTAEIKAINGDGQRTAK